MSLLYNLSFLSSGGSINGCRKPNVTSTTYYFAIPQSLVGRLIGRHGSFLHSIRTTAEVQILVSDNPNASEQKICSIEGSVESINIALGMIRKKFPEKKFPQVTLAEMATSEVTSVMAASSWVPQCTQLFLVDGVNNDILVSHIVKPHWLFIQIPTHPTYPSLRLLDASMTYAYNTIDLPIPSVLASMSSFSPSLALIERASNTKILRRFAQAVWFTRQIGTTRGSECAW